jgi:hypothetical protein
MTKKPSLDGLWNRAPAGQRAFHPDQLVRLPEAARHYLQHAIAPGAPLASAVRLRMHGQIKLGAWLPFTAEQVIRWGHGMIWSATVRRNGLPIRGFDRLLNGEGRMRWKLFGIIPVMTASGPDITRSAAGRLMAELLWLPSVLSADEMSWAEQDALHPRVRLSVQGEEAQLALTINQKGQLQTFSLPRWGNPGGAPFGYAEFGGVAEEESTFQGYTIPTRLRIGWYFGSDRFEPEGEFFRVTVDHTAYR